MVILCWCMEANHSQLSKLTEYNNIIEKLIIIIHFTIKSHQHRPQTILLQPHHIINKTIIANKNDHRT